MDDLEKRPWRIGTHSGRTIYAMVQERATEEDPLIGVMDTPELALDAVTCHNTSLNEPGDDIPVPAGWGG